MRKISRSIEEVKSIRGDLSNWLVHLTKDNFFPHDGKPVLRTAKRCLENILEKDVIKAYKSVGQFNYQPWYKKIDQAKLQAVCFTETPIEEIFLFPNIKGKNLIFSSYGLAFSKEDLAKKPYFTAPVMYFSQPEGDFHYLDVMNQMEQKFHKEFEEVLFLFDRFGTTTANTPYDFRWEREWRKKGDLIDILKLAKFGLCPEYDIDYFEEKFSMIFVDPFFNPKQIEKKLVGRGIIP